MGQWENEMRNALNQYSNNTGNIYSGLTSRELGAIANAAWARQVQEEAERKRLLEVQKQKEADAALERQIKLKRMQYELDDIENARNNKNLINTLAPYKPSFGFDSDTGENVTSGYSPISPVFDALASASGLNLVGGGYSKVMNDSAKAIGAESLDPDKYTKMKEPERQKAMDDVLPPYEARYEFRDMSPDIWKTKENNANKELVRDMINRQQAYNADARVAMNENSNNAKITNNQNTNQTKRDISEQNNNTKLILQGIKEGSIRLRFDNGKIAGYERVKGFKPSLTPTQKKEYEFYEREWLKRFKELELTNENLNFDELVDLATTQMGTIMKQLDKDKLKLFGEVTKREAKNLKAFDDNIQNDGGRENLSNDMLNDFNDSSPENPKGMKQILYSESGLE